MITDFAAKVKSSARAKTALFVAVLAAGVVLLIENRAAVFAFSGTVVVAMSLYVLSRYLVLRRLRDVSAAASRIASGDLSARLRQCGTDEIGRLADSLNTIAGTLADQRAGLEAMGQGRVKELTTLYSVMETVNRSLDLQSVLPKVLGLMSETFRVNSGIIVLLDRKENRLKCLAHQGLSEESVNDIVENGKGCTGDVILMNNVIRASTEGEGDCIPGLRREGIRSALVVPIAVRGEMLGSLGVYSDRTDGFTDEDEALLSTIGVQVGFAMENARLYEQTLELARVDGLTGVANRRHLMERLKQEIDRAERYETSLAVLMMDLDKFKSFNDQYGHVKGDELLKTFSSRVVKTVRTTDLVGRYGGEEFCVVLPNTSVKGAAIIAERIRKQAESIEIVIREGQPGAGRTVSIGVGEFSAGDTVEKLLAVADAALYRAKENGRNKVVL